MASLREQAYKQIRQKIVSLSLPPGSTIDESLLQKELNLGRTPIREALLRLSQERLVTIVPRRGMFVTEIGISDLRQIYEVRHTLEPMAAEYATRRGTPQHWKKMEDAIDSIPAPGSPGANLAMIEVDELCHHVMYDAANNQFLKDTLLTLYALSLRLWYYFLEDISSMHDVMQEHRALLEAFKAGDVERATRLMSDHITGFQEEILNAMVGQAAPREE